MSVRMPARARWLPTVLALIVVGAACTPIAAPAPAPTPKPKATTTSSTSTTTLPPAPQCIAMSTPDVDSEPPSPGDTTYDVAVDEGVGGPQVVTVQAASQPELDEKVARVEATIGPVTAVDEAGEVRALAVTPGNDPRYPSLQHTALEQMNFDEAWAAGADGDGVVIAIVDSGVQADHPDLEGNVLDGADFVGSTSGTCTDPFGHGTHVAGIADQLDNAIGGIGGAPLAKVLPVRVLDAGGSGTFGDVANGITWAVANGADVINLSLGGTYEDPLDGEDPDTPLNQAIQSAIDAGVIVVAAAGNCGAPLADMSDGCANEANNPVFPAAAEVAIAVGALKTDDLGQRADFSNNNDYVDIAAPGTSIDSTYPTSTYASFSGTSMSTPFVSAVVALILEACPGATQAGVLQKLQDTTSQAATEFTGVGLVDAAAAAAAAC